MDIFAGVIASEGFWMLVAAATVAGLVRGFSGFGTAMVYLPVAGQILTPFEALTTLLIMDLIGALPNIPQAFRTGHPADIMRLSLGALLTLPYLAANVSGGGLFAPSMNGFTVRLAISLLLYRR